MSILVQVERHPSAAQADAKLLSAAFCASSTRHPDPSIDADEACLALVTAQDRAQRVVNDPGASISTICVRRVVWSACVQVEPHPMSAQEVDEMVATLTALGAIAAGNLPPD